MDRVLAFGCHPDDVEFMCAGTLALLAERGYEIHIATMTGGEVGAPPPTTSAEIRARRLGEARDGAAVIGGHYHWAGGRDLEVDYSAENRRRAVCVVREVDPLIVFAPPPVDYLADHEQTSLLVRNAAYIASVPLYDCGTPARPTDRIPHVYYWNACGLEDIFGRPLPMEIGVDVTSVMATKTEMLSCHASQRDWLKFINGWDRYTSQMEDWSRRQGELIDADFAECFIRHRGIGHPDDDVLATALGDLCRPVKTD